VSCTAPHALAQLRITVKPASEVDAGFPAATARPRWPPCGDNDRMSLRLHHVVVDAHDLPLLARFWTQALGWKVLSEREREIVIGPDVNAPVGMCFMPVTDAKTVKNRVHVDLTTSAEDRDSEIERLLQLGARHVDIGQTGAESWTVLADPEGNEFCVVRPKNTLTG
jgi:predicted enzyme related to lactoylglutathione lyase